MQTNLLLRSLLWIACCVVVFAQEQVRITNPAADAQLVQGEKYNIDIALSDKPQMPKALTAYFALLDSNSKHVCNLEHKTAYLNPSFNMINILDNVIPVSVDLGKETQFKIRVSTSDNKQGYSELFTIIRSESQKKGDSYMIIIYIATPIVLLLLTVGGSVMMYKRMMHYEEEKEEINDILRRGGIEIENEDPLSIQMEERPVVITVPEQITVSEREASDYGRLEDEE
jgi:hypothetical protein